MTGIMAIRKDGIFQRDGWWYYEIDRKRLSLRTKDKSTAKKRFNAVKEQYLNGKLSRLRGECTVTLGAFDDEVQAWAASTQATETYHVWRNALRKLVAVCGRAIKLDAINVRHWDKLAAQAMSEGKKTISINVYLSGLRSVFGKAVEWGYIQANPFRQVKKLKVEKRAPAYIDPGHVGKFLASIADVHVRRACAALIFSGRRQGELLALRWEDVEEAHYTATIFKTKQVKRFPLHPMFKSVLDSMPRTEERVFPRWTWVNSLSCAIKAALRNAGLGHLRPHDLRHTFASALVIAGQSLRIVQELLAHSDIRSTQIYAHLSEDAMAEALGSFKGCPADFCAQIADKSAKGKS